VNWTPLRLSLTLAGASFLIVILVPVTEALQRITGIQIQRDLGEGSSPSIRGLTQMETLLNGREVSAAQLEGAVGGTSDLRTHRPFDFADREIAGSARLVYGTLVGKNEPQFSLLASDRWRTTYDGAATQRDAAIEQNTVRGVSKIPGVS
jgi:hypothetical protein